MDHPNAKVEQVRPRFEDSTPTTLIDFLSVRYLTDQFLMI